MQVRIRKYRQSDAEQVGMVGTRSWEYTYTDIFGSDYVSKRTSKSYSPENINRSAAESDKTCMFVAEVEGNIVGFAQPCYYNYWDPESFDKDRMMLSRIYLLPEYMRKGIGSKLLHRAEEWIESKGFNQYDLFVHKNNVYGVAFYRKKGFIVVEEANNEGEILMRKVIL